MVKVPTRVLTMLVSIKQEVDVVGRNAGEINEVVTKTTKADNSVMVHIARTLSWLAANDEERNCTADVKIHFKVSLLFFHVICDANQPKSQSSTLYRPI